VDSSVSQQQLTQWAHSCLRINHLNTLVQRDIAAGALDRDGELAERARRRAWELFNDMLRAGASKPVAIANRMKRVLRPHQTFKADRKRPWLTHRLTIRQAENTTG
jgi:hypothetical protein